MEIKSRFYKQPSIHLNVFGNEDDGLFEGLVDLISEWNPKKQSDEGGYKLALYDYLNQKQEEDIIRKDRTIRTEAGESRADLRVSGVAIELKKDLNNKPKRDRAENQIRLMLKEFDSVIVVVVGKNNKEAIEIFKHYLKEFTNNGDLLGNGGKIKVIEIKSSKPIKEKNRPARNSALSSDVPETPSLNDETYA